MSRLLEDVSTEMLQRQWDMIAPCRFEQISEGRDITYDFVLVPNILKLADKGPRATVLDAGCGVGFLTKKISSKYHDVIGVDYSSVSITIAKNKFGSVNNIQFLNLSIEDFSNQYNKKFDIVFANMVLMDVLDLKKFVNSVYGLLNLGGEFIFTITHPSYWPRYWGYEKEPWFEYKTELAIESDFRISGSNEILGKTVHFHRPLDAYFNNLCGVGFRLAKVFELYPDKQVHQLYPEPWKYPRYLAARFLKDQKLQEITKVLSVRPETS